MNVVYVVTAKSVSVRCPDKHIRTVQSRRIIDFCLDYLEGENIRSRSIVVTDDDFIKFQAEKRSFMTADEPYGCNSIFQAALWGFEAFNRDTAGIQADTIMWVSPMTPYRSVGLFKRMERVFEDSGDVFMAHVMTPIHQPMSVWHYNNEINLFQPPSVGNTEDQNAIQLSWEGLLWKDSINDEMDGHDVETVWGRIQQRMVVHQEDHWPYLDIDYPQDILQFQSLVESGYVPYHSRQFV